MAEAKGGQGWKNFVRYFIIEKRKGGGDNKNQKITRKKFVPH